MPNWACGTVEVTGTRMGIKSFLERFITNDEPSTLPGKKFFARSFLGEKRQELMREAEECFRTQDAKEIGTMNIHPDFAWSAYSCLIDGYRKHQRLRPEDMKAHEMHMGFSTEEKHRCKESPNPMFINRFPLVEMGLERADNYAYIRDVWGLETKASACNFCPFHRNYFFKYLKENEPMTYERLEDVDRLLEEKNPKPPMDSDLFISRSRKRLRDLTPEDCNDAECFLYRGKEVWNGF